MVVASFRYASCSQSSCASVPHASANASLTFIHPCHCLQLTLDFWAVCRSVFIYLGAPLVAGVVTRYTLMWAFGESTQQQDLLTAAY